MLNPERSFRALCEEALEDKKRSTRTSTQEQRQWLYEKYIRDYWGDRPAHGISRREIRQRLLKIADSTPSNANHLLSLLSMVFNYGLEWEFPGLEANPVHRMPRPAAEVKRDRWLTRNELRGIWPLLDGDGMLTAGILQIALFTAQRVGPIKRLEWSEIDWKRNLWSVPAQKFKSARDFWVPLSPQVVEILRGLRELTGDGQWVFPSRAGADQPYIEKVDKVIRERVLPRLEIERFVPHDFRTTFRTWATRATTPDFPGDPVGLGVEFHIADQVLGHTEETVGFQRYQGEKVRYLFVQKRDALERWGTWLEEVINSEMEE